MTELDRQQYEKSPLSRWVWRASPNACLACQALDGRKFLYPDVPARPHPNCRCTVEVQKCQLPTFQNNKEFGATDAPKNDASAEDMSRHIAYQSAGVFSGYDDGVREQFLGGQKIFVTVKNLGPFLGGVTIKTNLGGDTMAPLSVGQQRTIGFSHFGEAPLMWNVLILVAVGDNSSYFYMIDG
ncbi:hypothetical protein DGI_0427 [Megalodesulfovibrio gigas DSM 1382 = ATCC 19364]|uniref:Phage head morphogenesis domain-containing protein n=1 Tax=Megalodesulfovibrio gigas (strain ATCC 19364 / DSM 1382 / NCIMB 9332 / VKM B-1759) TaxID=1121448 RepID=T2G835_MEGG1|nr:hypothetical protein DGI_0427 [Megalodesulfovibrio gigas DSM 1382 = ATCC 19364]